MFMVKVVWSGKVVHRDTYIGVNTLSRHTEPPSLCRTSTKQYGLVPYYSSYTVVSFFVTVSHRISDYGDSKLILC